MNLDDWKSQIKRGTLEFCILLMIKQRPSYGYEIISQLEKYPILAAKESTVYPAQTAHERRGCIILLARKCRRIAAKKVLCHNGQRASLSFGHVGRMGPFGKGHP